MIKSLTEHAFTSQHLGQEPKKLPRLIRGKYFFVAMSILFVIIAIAGFVPSYQNMYTGEFPIHWFAHIHGALMTTWLLVFITQSVLAAKGLLKYHRQLGLSAVALGILMWVSMWIASVRALVGYKPPINHFLYDVLIVQFYGIVLFGLFFSWGIIQRKNASSHKRLLFLATLILLQAAIDRMHWLPWIHDGLAVRFYYLNAFLIPLYIYDSITIKRIHRITWLGTLLYIIAQTIVVQLWGSPAWHTFWFNTLHRFT